MYSLKKAMVKDRGGRRRWRELDVSNYTFAQMKHDFREILFTLENDNLNGDRFIRFSEMLQNGLRMDMTPEQYFSYLGNTPLPDSPDPFTIEHTHIRYADGWQSGFHIEYIPPGGPLNSNLPLADRTTALLQKTGIDYENMYKHTLVTVNGFTHLTDYNSDGLHVLQGGKSIQYANLNNFGIISFLDVAPLTMVSITESMVNANEVDGNNVALDQAAYIHTGQDLTNKSVILSLGGYLHVLDDAYQVVNVKEGIIKVRFRQINMIHRLFESRKYISLATLPIPTHQMNEDLLPVPTVYSPDVVKAYLTLPQSFAVVVDTPDLYVDKHVLQDAQLPGIYYSYQEPIYPIQLRTGILPEYWVQPEGDTYVLSVTDNRSRHYTFETTNWRDLPYVDDTLDPERYYYDPALAHFLEIGSESVTQ